MGSLCAANGKGSSATRRIRLVKYFDMDIVGVFNGLLDNGNILYPVICTFWKRNGKAIIVHDKSTCPRNKGLPSTVRNGQGVNVSRFFTSIGIIGRIVDEGKSGPGGIVSKWNSYRIQSGTIGNRIDHSVQNNFFDSQ